MPAQTRNPKIYKICLTKYCLTCAKSTAPKCQFMSKKISHFFPTAKPIRPSSGTATKKFLDFLSLLLWKHSQIILTKITNRYVQFFTAKTYQISIQLRAIIHPKKSNRSLSQYAETCQPQSLMREIIRQNHQPPCPKLNFKRDSKTRSTPTSVLGRNYNYQILQLINLPLQQANKERGSGANLTPSAL
jgi:hypothetical protein